VYSRIENVSSCLVYEHGSDGPRLLEPGYVLRALPKTWLDQETTLVVVLTDGKEKLEFELNSFLSKAYNVDGAYVRFGAKRLKLNGLSIHVGVKILLEDLSGLNNIAPD
jgi:hypothetical protein